MGALAFATGSIVDGDTVEFFDTVGTRLNPDTWVLMKTVEAAAYSVLDEIRHCILMDISRGVVDRVAQVQLAADMAVIFYLEGGLTYDQYINAVRGKGYIDIPGVEVTGRVLTIRVLEHADNSVATADINGNVIF